jgi:hypothetical protein
MTIRFACACGRQLHAADDHVGRRIKCPGCGQAHLVPQTTNTSPTPRSERAGNEGGSRTGLRVLLVLALVGAAGAGWWFFIRLERDSRPEGIELALIPGYAQGFVSIRMAEIWNSPVGHEIRAREPTVADRIERMTSLRPEAIERISLVILDSTKNLGYVVFKSRASFDRTAVLGKLDRADDRSHAGMKYYTGLGPDFSPMAIHLASTRVFVAGPEEAIQRCLAHITTVNPPPGPLTTIIARCNASHHVVAGLRATPEAQQVMQTKPFLSPFVDIRLLQATIDVEKEVVVKLSAQTETDEQAKKSQASSKTALGLIRLGLIPMALEGGEKAEMARKIGKVLDQVKIEQNGNELTTTQTTDAATLAALLLMLAEKPDP